MNSRLVKKKLFVGKAISIQWQKTALASSRLRIAVTKKFGNACARNLFKRRVREAFRHAVRVYTQKSFNITVLPKIPADHTFSSIKEDLLIFFHDN